MYLAMESTLRQRPVGLLPGHSHTSELDLLYVSLENQVKFPPHFVTNTLYCAD